MHLHVKPKPPMHRAKPSQTDLDPISCHITLLHGSVLSCALEIQNHQLQNFISAHSLVVLCRGNSASWLLPESSFGIYSYVVRHLLMSYVLMTSKDTVLNIYAQSRKPFPSVSTVDPINISNQPRGSYHTIIRHPEYMLACAQHSLV